MKTIGKIENNRVIKEYYGQGCIYKNFDAFENRTEEICYIPEHSGEDDEPLEQHATYTYQDFYYMAKEFMINNPDVYDWTISFGYTPQMIAKQLFLSLDWQNPYTLIDEWEQARTFTF